jgi:hypothetical protein
VSNRGSDLKLTRVSKGYSVEPLDDNIYHWELRFFDFDKSEPLSKDMKKMKVVSLIGSVGAKFSQFNFAFIGTYYLAHYIPVNIPICTAIYSSNKASICI